MVSAFSCYSFCLFPFEFDGDGAVDSWELDGGCSADRNDFQCGFGFVCLSECAVSEVVLVCFAGFG